MLNLQLKLTSFVTQLARLARDIWDRINDLWDNEARIWDNIF